MSTAMVVQQQEQSVVEFSDEQVDLLKRMVCPPGTSNDELNFFLTYAKRTGLDPFARQIYCMKKRDKFTVESTIDGFRLCAERTGEYEGQEDPVWCGEDGKWLDVWLDAEPPVACRVGVWRRGFKQALRAVALFEAYKQTYWDNQTKSFKLGPQWEKNGANMLAKCFSPDTEVLTTNGFELFSRVTGQILQVTPDGLQPCDAKPFSQKYFGSMVTLDSDDLNFSVTPNHDMVTDVGKIEALAMYDGSRARPVYRIPRCLADGPKEGMEISDDSLRIIGAYLADGSDAGPGSFRIEVSRERKVEWLDSIGSHVERRERQVAGSVATSTRTARTITTRKNKTIFTYKREVLAGLVGLHKEVYTHALAELSQAQALVLLDAWIACDGHTQKKSGVRRIYTSRPNHKAAIELLAVISGQSISQWKERESDIGSVPNWYATISSRSLIPVVRWGRTYHCSPHPAPKKHTGLELTPIGGKVWCVTVPSGEIVVRRHGFSMRCGNCAEALALRKAFPRELSGLYSSDEMAQAGNPPTDQGFDYEGTREKQQAVAQEKIAQLKAAQAAAAELPASTGAEKPPFDFKSMIENFQLIHKELIGLGGKKHGDTIYYDVLGRYGCEHCNEFSNAADAKAAYKDMLAVRRTWEKKPPPKEAEPAQQDLGVGEEDLPF